MSMDSPQMYDSYVDAVDKFGVKVVSNRASNLFGEDSVPDLADLNAPEISLDLQRLIEDTQFVDSVNSTLFGDILPDKNVPLGVCGKADASVGLSSLLPSAAARGLGGGRAGPLSSHLASQVVNGGHLRNQNGSLYMPQPGVHSVNFGTEGAVTVKREPVDPEEYVRGRCGPVRGGHPPHPHPQQQQQRPVVTSANLPLGQAPTSVYSISHSSNSSSPSGSSNHSFSGLQQQQVASIADGGYGKSLAPGKALHHKQSKKNVDKGSDEYRRRRERNNIAVRKSREKAKIRSRETEHKVKELQRENDRLQKRVDSLTKEVGVLRALFSNVGLPPESLQRELANTIEGLGQ